MSYIRFMDFYQPIRTFKSIWWFIFFNLTWGSIVSLYYNNYAFDSIRSFVEGAAFGSLISASYVYAFILIWYEMDKRYDWITQTGKRIFFGLFYGELFAFLSFAFISVLHSLALADDWVSHAIGTVSYAWKFPVINFIPSVLIVCAVAFFKNWSRSVTNTQRLQSEMMAYKFESLQNQLNPHFLFNSFNVLSNLVYDDQKLAVKFLDRLGEMYSYVLDSKNKELVKLSEELSFMESYVFLLKTRFEEKLMIKMEVQPDDSWLIAPMVLQLLIENAVKHNKTTRQSPLIISIFTKENYLFVTNSLQLKKVVEPSTNMGLKNIKERYGFFTKKPVIVSLTEESFDVGIPAIKREGEP